jgi:hypothetical protein
METVPMNAKQLLILLVLTAIIGGAGVVVYKNGNRSGQPAAGSAIGKKLLGEFPVNDVAKVLIREGTNQVTLEKKDGEWRVRERQDYPANYAELGSFLLKARDLKIVQNDKAGPSQLARLDLAPPGQGTNSALLLEFDDASGKSIRTLWLGKKHMKKSGRPSPTSEGDDSWPDGRWVKTGADSSDVALISDPLDTIDPKVESWLNKDFVRIEKAVSVSADFPVATNSWKITRATASADWKLADTKPGEELDPSKASGFSNPLSSPSFNDVRAGSQLAGTGSNAPVTIRISTFDHFDYTLRCGARTNDEYPVTVSVSAQLPKERAAGKDEKPEDKARLDKEFKDQQAKQEEKLKQEQALANWTYQVPNWVMEPLLKERSQLMVEKKPEPATATNSVPRAEMPK